MIAWIEIIKNLTLALTYYLKLKSETVFTDIQEKSYAKQDEIVREIQKLTQNSSPSSIARVNVLQLQLQQERERLTNISAYCPKSSS